MYVYSQLNFTVAMDTRMLPKKIEEPSVHLTNASQNGVNDTKVQLLSQFESIPVELQ